MTDDERCPRCGKELVIHGSFTTKTHLRFGFRPEELRLFSLSFQFPEVSITTAPVACAACGLIWANLDPLQLRQKLDDLGNEDVRHRLGLLDSETDA